MTIVEMCEHVRIRTEQTEHFFCSFEVFEVETKLLECERVRIFFKNLLEIERLLHPTVANTALLYISCPDYMSNF